MIATREQIAPYLTQFDATRHRLPGAGVPWLAALRRDAIARFAETGFPTPRDEDWKYTNLTRLERAGFGQTDGGHADPSTVQAELLTGISGPNLVFVDGVFAPALSDTANPGVGVTLTTLASGADGDAGLLEGRLGSVAVPDGNGLAALNAALMSDGVVLRLERNARADAPVRVVHVTTSRGAAVHPRNLIVAEEGSEASVVELFVGGGGGAYWTNAVTEIDIRAGATLHHLRLQQEDEEAFHIGLTQLRIGRDARYDGLVLSTGAALARVELRAALVGEGAEFALAAGALLRGRQHADITTVVDHRVPHGRSVQLVKNVLDDRSRAVFQGRVIVRPGAQKTNAHQTNRNLLLSPRAQADTKPELRIHADDVKCGHGATVGDLDADSLFYLTSRGIDPDAARRLLVEAFVTELLDGVDDPALRDACRGRVGGWFGEDATLPENAG